jgi:predicted DsbA family dithiol-disulfide isomerase
MLMKVEIYSDIVCPWCYIGERRFARALAAFPARDRVEVVFRPFQLDPEAPATPRPLAEALGRKFGARAPSMMARVSEAARGEGIDVRWDIALSANTLTAHRLLRLAEREEGADVQRALAERLFDAHFTRGLDVGDAGVLADLAAEAGMERERVTAYLATDEGLRDVCDEIEQAQARGVTAVPTFVFDGKYVVQGGQPAPILLQALEEVGRLRRAAEPADEESGAAACADGTCRI